MASRGVKQGPAEPKAMLCRKANVQESPKLRGWWAIEGGYKDFTVDCRDKASCRPGK